MIWSRSGATLPAEFVTSTRSDITPAIPLMTAGFETYGLLRTETDGNVCGLPLGTATLLLRTNQVRGDWENEFAFLSPRFVEKALSGARDVTVSTKQLVFDVELSSLWSEQAQQVSSHDGQL